MQAAANNQNAGPAMAFMGMNMAGQAGGVNAQNLYQMGAQQAAQQPAPAAAAPAAPAGAWTCPQCGKTATGKFCPECGAKKPEADGWTCPTCGKLNKGKFCAECGTKKPAGVPQYKVRQVRLGARRSDAPAEVLPRMRRPVQRRRYHCVILTEL